MEDEIIIEKLEKIESEVHNLKMTVRSKQKPLKLGGIWARVDIADEDFEEAKRSLFKAAQDEDL